LLPLAANATQQVGEAISVDGEQRYSDSQPFDGAEKIDGQLWRRLTQQLSPCRMSADWRGYVGTWAIKKNELFLVSVRVATCGDPPFKEIPLSALRPGATGPIKAEWFSGEILLEKGPRIPGPCGFSPDCPSGYEVLIFERGNKVRSEYRALQQQRQLPQGNTP
jgi:hypothetical protein